MELKVHVCIPSSVPPHPPQFPELPSRASAGPALMVGETAALPQRVHVRPGVGKATPVRVTACCPRQALGKEMQEASVLWQVVGTVLAPYGGLYRTPGYGTGGRGIGEWGWGGGVGGTEIYCHGLTLQTVLLQLTDFKSQINPPTAKWKIRKERQLLCIYTASK